MTRRRLVLTSVALGTGLLAGAAVGGRDLLRRQAAAAREQIGKPLGEEALAADRTWKKKYGDRVDLLVLGDSPRVVLPGRGGRDRGRQRRHPPRARRRVGGPPQQSVLGSRASRQLAAAQARAVEPLGAHVVSLADAVGPFFTSAREEMFSLDRFHPSSLGYKRTAQALLPHLVEALHG